MDLYVRKDDDSLEKFNLDKLNDSIRKAFKLCNKPAPYAITYFVSTAIMLQFSEPIYAKEHDNTISSADIINIVDKALNKGGYVDEATAYVNYIREKKGV